MKYYVVLKGRQTGIFTNRDECKRQVDGFFGAIYKSFYTQQAAEFAWKEQIFWQKWQSSRDYLRTVMGDEFDRAICTDAACPSNPGPVEYRGVSIASGKEIFSYGPYQWWSVNIAEFLAIVEWIKYFIGHSETNLESLDFWWNPETSSGWQRGILYSDSKIALNRVKKWKVNTQIIRDIHNTILFKKIEQAEHYLYDCPHRSQFVTLKKRPTSQRGQIPADFGRK